MTESVNVLKVDESLGLVFGFAIVCKVDGEEYYDTQGDYIPEEVMLEAAAEFSVSKRATKDMHGKDLPGSVVFSFPMTTEVAQALGFEVPQTGWLVAMKPDDEEVLAKFKSGEYTGFSIGGTGSVEDVE